MNRKTRNVSVLLASAAMAVAAPFVSADPWSFGVMADTQWTGTDPTGNNINSVAVNQVNACNQAFVNAGVKFVVQVGDLGDNGTVASLTTRLNANTALNTAGIPFYGLRGNHEDNSSCMTYFQGNYVPTTTSSALVALAPDNISYSVTYNNTKIVLLDILTADSTSAMTTATTWMGGQLSAADHQQAFVFQHKNLIGQNHHDNAFETGSNQDANPTQQNAFFSTLAGNGVRYDISGHDHVDYRSTITSPDGNSKVQELICASDSYKYYTPGAPTDPRDQPISEQLNKTGYYIFTVDGPRLTANYYSTTPLANGDVPANATFALQESFGSSLNGKQNLVAQGASYAMTDNTDKAVANGESGYITGTNKTTATILRGTNGSTQKDYMGRNLTKDVETGWTARANNPSLLASDILTIWGMTDVNDPACDTFALSMNFDPSLVDPNLLNSGEFALSSQDANGLWVNTVDLNTGGTKNFVFGAFDSSYGLGTYGVDISNDTVWAVVNHDSTFAAAVPAPSAAWAGLVLLSGIAGAGAIRRRNAC